MIGRSSNNTANIIGPILTDDGDEVISSFILHPKCKSKGKDHLDHLATISPFFIIINPGDVRTIVLINLLSAKHIIISGFKFSLNCNTSFLVEAVRQ